MIFHCFLVPWCLDGVDALAPHQRSGILVFDSDSERPQKLSILRGQLENGLLAQVGIELLAVDEISFAPFVESDRHFQDQEKVISRSTDAAHNVRNLVRFRQGLVDRVTQFFDQTLEVIVQIQGAPYLPLALFYDSSQKRVKVQSFELG